MVNAVDGPYGSLPHSLMIDHDNGYSSFYGHLLETPTLRPGQPVVRGEPVALSGDALDDCRREPSLHLEIRNSAKNRAVNPVPLIEADWDSLALTSDHSLGFERDLGDPHRWQAIDDQPDVIFGGALLNDYTRPWPFDPARR